LSEEQKPHSVKVVIPDEEKSGTYANFLVVSHSPHEFTLDFCQLQPRREGGETIAQVVSRIQIAPTLVGKVIQALNTNMTNYEDRFGPIPVRD
jgi:hypothetical protein